MQPTFALAAASVMMLGGFVMATPALADSSTTTAEQSSVNRKSKKCNKPKGKRFNISWSDGSLSTTFYFNNHCRGTNYIGIWTIVNRKWYCVDIKVKPGVKGKKKIWTATPKIEQVTLKKCP
ncbi:hypothetical protein ABZ897_36415 [Nonomuraea sp. NPDC046802]|uniref:hypothetical protein n=1 Tax=Nonomuraea sp. NPDC046802 TaxID=3154919 RepID=UPI00340E7D74